MTRATQTTRGATKDVQRRRGQSLETAILRAAWEELAEVGYAKLTMEGVAARAETSKAVIYRRWPTRATLIIAAMRQEAPVLTAEVPDTGSLRGDLLALLRRMAARLRAIGPEAVHGLLVEGAQSYELIVGIRRVGAEVIRTLVERAIERGELPRRTWSDRVLSLPLDLARHELILTKAPASPELLQEIVDEIFLPLLRSPAETSAPSRAKTPRRRQAT